MLHWEIVRRDHEKEKLTEFVRDALALRPLSTSRDIYKLLYQSFHGAEHAVTDSNAAREWLEEEWCSLSIDKPVSERILIEPIYIEGMTPELYRINLAPAKSAGIERSKIHAEFLRTATRFPRGYPGTADNLHERFIEAWMEIGNAVERGEVEMNSDDYRKITSMAESNEWGAMHHSETYHETYVPHYRLIMDPDRVAGE